MNFLTNLFTNKAADDGVCSRVCEQLSTYVDNTLAARDVWEVEKHLRGCADCAEVSRQMQATVQLLRSVERQDTGDDFMAKLHARLDGLEPEPARRRSLAEQMQEWGANLRGSLSSRRVPGFSLGMAAAGVAALAVFTHLPTSTTASATQPAAVTAAPVLMDANTGVHGSLQRNVALTANDPLGDVAAEYLESADNGKETNGS